MPNVEKTPRQTVRVEKELWDKAGAMVGTRQRGQYVRDFLRWLTGETDEMPQRPSTERDSDPATPAGHNEGTA